MGTDPAPFWANLFLYFFETNCIKQLISNKSSKEYEYHGVSIFIDTLCAINDEKEFLTSLTNIYPKVLDHKVEHLRNHAWTYATHLIKNLVMNLSNIF